ncbi:MAG: hypothetical protein RIB71_26385 [Imperialibacter sp.]|uniref:hypothetical protein n=1 Tax=Imperialibacter sp. TaxID=2038411 RepID=UPI0032EF77BD
MIWKELLNSQRYGATKSINFDPARSPFEMDYDRIIFSYPFRRLQDKTQARDITVFKAFKSNLLLERNSIGVDLW